MLQSDQLKYRAVMAEDGRGQVFERARNSSVGLSSPSRVRVVMVQKGALGVELFMPSFAVVQRKEKNSKVHKMPNLIHCSTHEIRSTTWIHPQPYLVLQRGKLSVRTKSVSSLSLPDVHHKEDQVELEDERQQRQGQHNGHHWPKQNVGSCEERGVGTRRGEARSKLNTTHIPNRHSAITNI
jgi:hypothetical protein